MFALESEQHRSDCRLEVGSLRIRVGAGQWHCARDGLFDGVGRSVDRKVPGSTPVVGVAPVVRYSLTKRAQSRPEGSRFNDGRWWYSGRTVSSRPEVPSARAVSQ